LEETDLPPLARLAPFAFLDRPSDIGTVFPVLEPVRSLVQAGLSLVLRHSDEGCDVARTSPHRRMGSLEFLLSDSERLTRSPMFAPRRADVAAVISGNRHRAVALLDLVQDFEILGPLLARASSPDSSFDLRVAITERVVKSSLWPHVQEFMALHAIPWFTPLGASDVTQALGSRKSLLLTASESTAGAHNFGHTVCRVAPPRALRVTMQHGLECVGLRHHRAHDIDLPVGVRFASDIVLTWDETARLPDLHPGEIDKCVPVGVIKALAEDAALAAEERWLTPAATRPANHRQRLLVAENLHSVRFRSPGRYQRFLRFIRTAQHSPDVELTIRSHPASRTLEKQRDANQLLFLDDMLRLGNLATFDSFVSPPSTILFDAVLAGVPAAVWTDSVASGDAVNYDGLPAVADYAEWSAIACAQGNDLDAMAWAVRSTNGLNGVPAAWNSIVRLFG